MNDELSLTLSILRFHTGEANAISAKQLARDLGFSEKDTRTVRTIIRELRRLGEPILASTDGYFLPNSYEEADRFCQKLRDHAIEEIITRRDIRRALAGYFEEAKMRRLFD
jgi:biotin operon repressor